jgi:small neutral amino acid transporter SnatA (MarC family)
MIPEKKIKKNKKIDKYKMSFNKIIFREILKKGEILVFFLIFFQKFFYFFFGIFLDQGRILSLFLSKTESI